MSTYPEEFVTDGPGRKPRGRLPTPGLQAASAALVELRIRIGRIDEHVRVDDEHLASSFHRIVKGVAVRDVNQMATTSEDRQGRQLTFRLAPAGMKEKPERGFHQLRHGPILARCFPAQAGHDGVVDVQGCFQMDNHMVDMAIWSTLNWFDSAVKNTLPLQAK